MDHSNPQDRNLIHEFGKEMKFDKKQRGGPSNRDKSLIKLLNSSAILVSRNSTIFLSSDPNELCDRVIFLLQEKQSRNNSNTINDEILAFG